MQHIYFRLSSDDPELVAISNAVQAFYDINIPGNISQPYMSADETELMFKCPFVDQVQIDSFLAENDWAKLSAEGGTCIAIWDDNSAEARAQWVLSQSPHYDPDFVMPSDAEIMALFNT